MRLINNNISPLPFYDSINLQNHRKDYAFGQIYPLITYSNLLLPFQIVVKSGISYISAVYLCEFNTGNRINITSTIKENGLSIKSYDDFSIISYPGTLPIKEITHEGFYHIEMNVTGIGWLYSDIFNITYNVDSYMLLEYYNSYNLDVKGGIIDFSDNFKFKCYINTQIGKPEYVFEEEATERMGYTFIESQVSKKIYRFTFTAPEYLCDALRIVKLCDNKSITSKSLVYDLTMFNMEVEWEEQGDLAAVECEFETDTVIVSIGGYTADSLKSGDFNNDFNNDFNS